MVTRFTSGDKNLATNQPLFFGDDQASAISYNGTSLQLVPSFGDTVQIVGIPTASAGLASGDLWSDAGTIKIIP